MGDPLLVFARHIDFDHLTQVIDELLPRDDATKGGHPPYPGEVMVRILILKYLYNLSDEQMEYQLLDHMLQVLLLAAGQRQHPRSQHHLALPAAPE